MDFWIKVHKVLQIKDVVQITLTEPMGVYLIQLHLELGQFAHWHE